MQLTDFLGSGAVSSAYQIAYSSGTAADAVSQGDALTTLVDGTVTYALPPSDPNYALRPLVQVGDLTNTVTKNTVVSTGVVSAPAKLTSGNIAVPVIAPTTSYPQVFIYAPSGALLYSVTLETVSVTSFKIAALAGGGFVAAYKAPAGLRYGVYDNSGAVVTAAATQTANATTLMGITALSNGGFSLLWVYYSSGYQISTAAFSATGIQQGVTTAIETVASPEAVANGTYVVATAPYGSSGGYCVTYSYTTGSQTLPHVRVAFFSSTAVLQNSLIDITTRVSVRAEVKLATLTDGSIVLVYSPPSNLSDGASNGYVKYSAAGVQVVAPTQIDTANASSIAVVAMTANTFGLFYNDTSNDLLQKLYDGSGALIGGVTTYSSAFGSYGGNGSYTNLDIQQLADGTWLAAVVISGTAGTPRGVRLNSALNTALASGIVLDTVNGSITSPVVAVIPTVNPVTSSSTAMVVYAGATPDVRIANFVTLIKARSFIGVATASAASGLSVTMQIIGPAKMTKSFAPSLAVNYQGNAIPGQKASLIGTTAILNGVQ